MRDLSFAMIGAGSAWLGIGIARTEIDWFFMAGGLIVFGAGLVCRSYAKD